MVLSGSRSAAMPAAASAMPASAMVTASAMIGETAMTAETAAVGMAMIPATVPAAPAAIIKI